MNNKTTLEKDISPIHPSETLVKSNDQMKLRYKVGIFVLTFSLILIIGFSLTPKKSRNTTPNTEQTNTNNLQPDTYQAKANTHEQENFIGDMLYNYNDLNDVAIDKDAILLYIPVDETSPLPGDIKKTLLDFQDSLEVNLLKVGVFTLKTTAPEYADMASKVSLPNVLIACKGKGMSFVPGYITRDNLNKAFSLANVTPTGCGSSGCVVP